MDIIVQLGEEFAAALPNGAAPNRMAKKPFGALEHSGHPSQAAGPLVKALLTSLDAMGAPVSAVLPARLIRSRRMMIDVPVGGRVSQDHLSQALDQLSAATDDPRRAVLYRHPSGFLLDGVPGEGDPVGKAANVLTVDAFVMCADIRALAKIERVIAAGGGRLTGVVPTPLAVCAATLPADGTGTVIHIGHSETTVASIKNHFLVGAASRPIGFRHLLSDVMQADEIDRTDAMAAIHTHARTVPAGKSSVIAQAIDARLAELGEWVAQTLPEIGGGAAVLSGAIADTERLSHVWPAISLTSSTLSAKGPFAPLLGASSVLDGSFGVHGGASVADASLVRRGGDVVRWLKAHF